jgi:hypothetical protein
MNIKHVEECHGKKQGKRKKVKNLILVMTNQNYYVWESWNPS